MKQTIRVVPSCKWLLAIIAFIYAFGLQVQPAFAHAKLVKSDPPRRAALSVAPKHVQLWFNEEIESNFASISVKDANGNPVTDEGPEPVPEDLKSVLLPLPELNPGKYTVKFRILSTDGHVIESNYNFTLKNTE